MGIYSHFPSLVIRESLLGTNSGALVHLGCGPLMLPSPGTTFTQRHRRSLDCQEPPAGDLWGGWDGASHGSVSYKCAGAECKHFKNFC